MATMTEGERVGTKWVQKEESSVSFRFGLLHAKELCMYIVLLYIHQMTIRGRKAVRSASHVDKLRTD